MFKYKKQPIIIGLIMLIIILVLKLFDVTIKLNKIVIEIWKVCKTILWKRELNG